MPKWWKPEPAKDAWLNLDQVMRVVRVGAVPTLPGNQRSAVKVFEGTPARIEVEFPSPVGKLIFAKDEEIKELLGLLGIEYPIAPPS